MRSQTPSMNCARQTAPCSSTTCLESTPDAGADRPTFLPPRAQRARGAGVRVDQPGSDRRPGPQGHRLGGLGRQSSPERRARPSRPRADAGIIVVFEEPEAHAVEEFVRPALLMREIGEFAGRRAGRAGQRPRGAKRQEIREIEEMPSGADCFRLAPERASKLRRMHLGRDLPPT